MLKNSDVYDHAVAGQWRQPRCPLVAIRNQVHMCGREVKCGVHVLGLGNGQTVKMCASNGYEPTVHLSCVTMTGKIALPTVDAMTV